MSLFSDPRWGEAWAHLPDYLGSHVRVSVTAIALGLAVSLPLAVVARDRPVMQRVLLAFASIVQTVPGLALLALFYPLLLAGASLTLKWFGFGFSAFGFLPAVLALALYSMLPVLRNTVTGLRGIDTSILEAAQGVGMTRLQSLTKVELPLALPVMMAGIRTASVWVIGTATLSTPSSTRLMSRASRRLCGSRKRMAATSSSCRWARTARPRPSARASIWAPTPAT